MDFKEMRAAQKSIIEKGKKGLDDPEIRKAITDDFLKLGEEIKITIPLKLTPVYDKLKAGDFVGIYWKDFIQKLAEAAKELGEEESLTKRIVEPAEKWMERREGDVANEGVDQSEVDQEIDYVADFINGKVHPESEAALESGQENEGDEPVEIALEDVKTKLNIGDKFKLKGKISHLSSEESAKKTRGNYNSISVEFPFNNDWEKNNIRFTAYFQLKDDEKHSFKPDDKITVGAKIKEIKAKKSKDKDTPLVYYGLYFEAPEGFKRNQDDYVNFAPEKPILKNMIDGPALESVDPENQGENQESETPSEENVENEGNQETATESTESDSTEKPDSSNNEDGEEESTSETDDSEETATESTDQDFEDFEHDEETENQLAEEIKGDYQTDPEMALVGYDNEMTFNPDVATEKAKDVDEKKWKYAKKIVLKARFDKEPSGDNEKDNDIITDGKAWGFVQDRYQKLKSGKIKARKPATESAEQPESEDPKPADETPATESVEEIEVELIINEEEIKGDPSKLKEPPATESVDDEEIEDDDEYIVGG